jgi:O-antigen/teichoic acid export membrane protein
VQREAITRLRKIVINANIPVGYFRLKRLVYSPFVHDVATLVLGTAFAQAISIIISPFLTRLYRPEEFGFAATYTAYVAIFSLIATFRYELVIPLPSSDIEAANLVVLTLKICAAMSLLFFPIILIMDRVIVGLLGGQALGRWAYLLPISIFLAGVFNTFQFWFNRIGKYKEMSVVRLQNSLFTSIANVLLGLGGIHGGLVFGALLGQTSASSYALYQICQKDSAIFTSVNWSNQREALRKYLSLIQHIVPSHLIGTVAMQLPIFIMSNAYSLETAGFFSLAYRMITLPTILVASAIGDVYRQRAARDFNFKGEFMGIYIKTLIATTLLALPFYLLLVLVGPDVFALIFGESWRVAGEYARILAVGAFFQFVFTPIDKGALIVGAKRYIFLWHLMRFMLLLGLLMGTTFGNIEVEITLCALVIINSTLYIADGIVGFKFARGVFFKK